MVARPDFPLLDVETYLSIERESPIKHEFIDGHVYLMAGGTRAHGGICLNILLLLANHLEGRPCRVYTSDVKVQLSEHRYVYPDATITCDDRDAPTGDDDTIHHPQIVLEVTSPSTEAYDREGKRLYYQECPSIRDYVVIDGRRQRVEVFSRQTDGQLTLVNALRQGDELVLTSIAWQAPVSALYRDITFAEGIAQ